MKKVWCFDCADKDPARFSSAVALVHVTKSLGDGRTNVDKRLIGCCAECLQTKNELQRKNAKPVDPDNPNLVYTHI